MFVIEADRTLQPKSWNDPLQEKWYQMISKSFYGGNLPFWNCVWIICVFESHFLLGDKRGQSWSSKFCNKMWSLYTIVCQPSICGAICFCNNLECLNVLRLLSHIYEHIYEIYELMVSLACQQMSRMRLGQYKLEYDFLTLTTRNDHHHITDPARTAVVVQHLHLLFWQAHFKNVSHCWLARWPCLFARH